MFPCCKGVCRRRKQAKGHRRYKLKTSAFKLYGFFAAALCMRESCECASARRDICLEKEGSRETKSETAKRGWPNNCCYLSFRLSFFYAAEKGQ